VQKRDIESLPMGQRRRWTDTIEEFSLVSPGGSIFNVLNFGASIRDCRVRLRDGSFQRVVLGLENAAHYPQHSPFFGTIAGRFANRIAGASYHYDGKTIHLTANEGRHCLHGGANSMVLQPWRLLDLGSSHVALGYRSEDGENGFPGNLSVECCYRFENEADLVCELSATTDAPTPINLAQHNYYNLDGSADSGAHVMQVHADFYTPTDSELIPTGEIRHVGGSPYDFRQAKPLLQMSNGKRQAFDGNFVLRSGGRHLAEVATVSSLINGLRLDVLTDQPGLQFYSAHGLSPAVPGLGGVHYQPWGGFCLEPQNFPDAVNRLHFPDPMLLPGQHYRQKSIFRFVAP
jgi:aldose 1-epimerase